MKKVYLFILSIVIFVYASGWFFCQIVYPAAYRDLLKQMAQTYQWDPLLLGSIIFTESRYNSQAISPAGAVGLMQIMPLTAAEVAQELGMKTFVQEDLLRQEINVRIGCYYLSKLRKRLKMQEFKWILAAYNAGESTVLNWIDKRGSTQNVIQFPETRHYVIKIKVLYSALKVCQIMGIV